MNLSITDAVDALEISLSPLNPALGISLSVRDVHYLAIHRMPRSDISLLDFTAQTLLPSAPWPPELPTQFITPDPAPPLLWLHGVGAATFDVVAAKVVVLAQAD
ncbi:hypothetical protein [Nocardia sp. NPDC004604]|uniref:hypothetical protein n=1 Tax=Nocardia sp. NPDC004604 TaxID=3157013 RepID=UPI0033A10C88